MLYICNVQSDAQNADVDNYICCCSAPEFHYVQENPFVVCTTVTKVFPSVTW